MAPPTNRPRLRDLDPAELALDIATTAISHIYSQQTQLFDLTWEPSLPEPKRTEIYRVVRALAGYARGEHRLDAPVHEYLVSLVPLWLAPLGDASSGDVSDESPESPLGVVIHAALGREELAAGHPLTTARLAVLASMARDAVGQLIRRGELVAERDADGDWRVSAAEAQRWLSARGAIAG